MHRRGLRKTLTSPRWEENITQEGAQSEQRVQVPSKQEHTSGSARRCFSCGETGHIAKNCRSPAKPGAEPQESPAKEAD